MSRFTLALGIALLVVEASAAVALITTNDQAESTWTTIALALTAGTAFVVSGLIALIRRPENRTGVYLAAIGYVWFLGALSDSANEWLFTIGFVVGDLIWVPFTALVLAYPTGRLESRLERVLPLAVGVLLMTPAVLTLLFDPDPAPDRCEGCPGSAIVVSEQPGLGAAFNALASAIGLGLIVLVVAILVRRWRSASPALRRVLWPVVGAGVATLVSVGLIVVADRISGSVAEVLQLVFFAAFSTVPLAFLFGILRTRLARSSVSDLVVAVGEGVPLGDALSKALGDTTVEVAYLLDWRRGLGGGGWVDFQGTAVPDPASDDTRAVRFVERDGERIAAVRYDPGLDAEPELVDAVIAAAGLALRNERLQAELRAEVTFMNTVTNTTPSLLVNVGTDGRIRNINTAALAATGFDDEEAVRGQHFWNVFIDPGERDEMVARFHSLAPDFPAGEYENTFTNARGEERTIYWRSAPVQDDQGHVASIVSGGLDITERHRLEVAKQRERDFFNAIANNARSLLCLIDHAGRVTEQGANSAFVRTLGWRDDEVGGKLFWEHWVDGSDAEDVRTRIERVVAGETPNEHDNQWITKDGGRLSIAWTCAPLPKIDERTLFLITGVDVTERKRREEEIRAGEERFRAVVESAPVAIAEIGLDDTVKLWNPAAERIFGWSHEEVLGRPPPWIPEDLQHEFRALSAREAEGSGYTGYETVRNHRDGRRLDVEISAAPIRDAAGGVVGAMAVLSDIGDRKRHEEELRASRARLVAAADEARQQLERNLHDGAQQRLVALSVSLRLAESKLTDDPAAAASIVAGAREELAHALAELRELARGIHPAILTDRGLAPAVDALVARTPVPVDVDVPSGRLPAAVEAASYYVVAEALTNVAKYSGASGASVQITREDGRVVIEVTDDGAGGADPAKGSGLRGLVDRVAALDGTLLVESPVGRGTRVRAEIPVSKPGAEQ